ncbi:MAG: endonuclease/exonuclease/phosphatase family protein [Rhodothermales bacterium]|nr:endonuclease/exonuclease/phosphatase family protein [Rhodothermales bacterium]
MLRLPPLAGLLMLAGCAAPMRPALPPLRMATFNIHAGKDTGGTDNLDRLAAWVRAERPDVLLLQEVDVETTRSGGVDQPARIVDAVGGHIAFGKTLDFQGGQYGIAVWSRFPIRRHALRHLPIDPPQARAGGSYEPRGALVVEIDAPGRRLTVVNTHLDASGSDMYRQQEAATLLALSDSLRRTSATVVVGGDFNATPNADVIGRVRAAGWHDAWATCGSDDGFTFSARQPIKRIDYLWLDESLGCTSARVSADTLSDHRALVVSGVR